MAMERQEQINSDLNAFESNPAEFMNRLPVKRIEQQGDGALSVPAFDQTALEDKAYVSARDALRQQATCVDTDDGRAAFAANDEAEGFVDVFSHSGLESMERSGLMSARLPESPWSDDYWAIYLGMLGKRYADRNFPKNSFDWNANCNYVLNNSAANIMASGNQEAISRLSPSEKYDILVGDKNFLLTRKMWEEGKPYYLKNGKVETWMGICHGWAPAAYMLPRPVGMATVAAANGAMLTFYPSDIKALASLLWAKTGPKPKFIGGRCNDSKPAVDPDTGRILAQNCFDTNPGTWHLAVVNQIGVAGRSMVMDATYDYEVWNQPLVGYSYTYFNPATNVAVDSLSAATVQRADFAGDKFAKYRSQATDSIVGIVMDVFYIVETEPSRSPVDGPQRDAISAVRYLYDLELDFSGKIIGGEWRQNAHPDFLWTPAPGSRALPPWESRNPLDPRAWQLGQPVPDQWRQIATITSEYSKTPLAAVVERLIDIACNNG